MLITNKPNSAQKDEKLLYLEKWRYCNMFFFYREVRKSGSPFLGTVGVLDVFSRMSLAQPLQALGSIFSFVKRMFFYAFVWRSFVFV